MRPTRARGFTLVELLVTVTIVSIVMTTAVQATIMVARGQGPRAIVADVQGEGRRGLSLVQADVREASLGASTGIVWTEVNGNRTAVPAVQIFDNVGGGGFLDVKPGTDVLLIVRARSRPSGGVSAKVVGDVYATNVPFTVTGLSEPGGDQLSPGTFALVGSYDEAVWVPVQNADAGTMTITPGLATSLLPGTDKMIASGSPVRHARAFLWFVNNRDELVRIELTVPRAPAETDARAIDIVARGVENLQVGCALETMNGVGACPAPGVPGTETAVPALGPFGLGGGARLEATDASIGKLRTVTLGISVRSAKPPEGQAQASPPIAIDGVTLDASGQQPNTRFLRRAYQIGVAVRNTSLRSL